jgi:hypothetical protein
MRAAHAAALEVFGPEARMLCHGCGERMPLHASGYCLACALGLDACAAPTRVVRAALELLAEHGPAGKRGVRSGETRALARRRYEQQRRAAKRPTPVERKDF